MTDTEILEDLKRIIHKQFGIEEERIEEDSYLDEDLNITDLDIEDLLNTLSQKYDIEFPESSTQTFEKVSDLVNFIFDHADTTN